MPNSIDFAVELANDLVTVLVALDVEKPEAFTLAASTSSLAWNSGMIWLIAAQRPLRQNGFWIRNQGAPRIKCTRRQRHLFGVHVPG